MAYTCYNCGDQAIGKAFLVRFPGGARINGRVNHQLDHGCYLLMKDVVDKVVQKRNIVKREITMLTIKHDEEEAKEEETPTPEEDNTDKSQE